MGSTNVLSSKLKELRKHYAAKSTILLNSEVFRLHRSSLPPVDLLILSAFLCHCSNPVANKRGQHLTLTCVNSTLVASRPLICTDLPSSQAGPSTTVGIHFSEWVQIFQKKIRSGEPILGVPESKLNMTDVCSRGSSVFSGAYGIHSYAAIWHCSMCIRLHVSGSRLNFV